MKRYLVFLLIGLAAAGIGIVFLGHVGWAEDVAPYKIASMQAKLFYTDRGTFSDNIIDNSAYRPLYNTIIGEGASGGPADDVLVIIKITGKPGSYAERAVTFKATSGKKVLVNTTSSISVLNDKGEGYVAFWVYRCTDSELRLRAEITNQKTKAAVNKVIPFEGGE